MEQSKKVIATSMIITIFVLAVSLTALYVQAQIEAGTVCTCAIPLPVLIPLISSIGLLLGTFIYYIYSPIFEKKEIDTKPLLKFLDTTEQRIMATILDNKGEISQARIASSTGLPKVKVFRTIGRLKSKGIVSKEPHGKTNLIKLNDDIRKLFFQ